MRISQMIMILLAIAFLFPSFIFLFNYIGESNTYYSNYTINESSSQELENLVNSSTNMVYGSDSSIIGVINNLGSQYDPLTTMYIYFSFFISATVNIGKILFGFITIPYQLVNLLVLTFGNGVGLPMVVIEFMSVIINLGISLFYLWFVFKIVEVIFGKVM